MFELRVDWSDRTPAKHPDQWVGHSRSTEVAALWFKGKLPCDMLYDEKFVAGWEPKREYPPGKYGLACRMPEILQAAQLFESPFRGRPAYFHKLGTGVQVPTEWDYTIENPRGVVSRHPVGWDWPWAPSELRADGLDYFDQGVPVPRWANNPLWAINPDDPEAGAHWEKGLARDHESEGVVV